MLNKKNIGFVLFAILFGCNQTFAVQIPQTMKDTMAVNTVGMPSLLNLIISMIVVIAMIYVTGFIYSKLNVINKAKLSGLINDKDKHRFTVLQSLSLGQQRHIYSIEMDGKIFLVGSTPNQISLIKEFDENSDLNSDLNSDINDLKNEFKNQFIEPTKEKNIEIDIKDLYKKYKN